MMDRSTRAWTIARVAGALALAVYFVAIILNRMGGAWRPYTAHGDQNQAVWEFWRYHVPGALPPGNLLTDYAFAYHAPPGYWALMAGLSTIFEPLTAGKLLQVVTWVALVVVTVIVVGKRTEWLLGIAAAFIVVRSPDLPVVASGGLARGFGPLLVFAFLGAYMWRKHTLCLVLLVLQAAIYPPPVMACGVAYGVDCVLRGPMDVRLRRCAGMFVAGVLVLALGQYQNLKSPDWWGPLMTVEEAKDMPAWARVGGRIPEVPLRPIMSSITGNIVRGYKPGGHIIVPDALQKLTANEVTFLGFPALLALVAVVVDRVRRRGRTLDPDERLPWEILAISAGALVAYFAARAVAFKLYLPQRQLTHTLPFLLQLALPLLAWCGARAVVGKERRAAALAIAVGLSIAPTYFFRGDGLGGASLYSDLTGDKPIFERIRQLPLDAVIACDHYMCDNLGQFGYHTPYANRTMTHPFRKGYYDEAERRLELMSKTLYATTWKEVADFGANEHVDYFIYNLGKLKAPEKSMHEPAKRNIAKMFAAAQKKGMVLEHPPDDAVIFKGRNFIFLDLKKVKQDVDDGLLPAEPFIGPMPEPKRAPQ